MFEFIAIIFHGSPLQIGMCLFNPFDVVNLFKHLSQKYAAHLCLVTCDLTKAESFLPNNSAGFLH